LGFARDGDIEAAASSALATFTAIDAEVEAGSVGIVMDNQSLFLF